MKGCRLSGADRCSTLLTNKNVYARKGIEKAGEVMQRKTRQSKDTGDIGDEVFCKRKMPRTRGGSPTLQADASMSKKQSSCQDERRKLREVQKFRDFHNKPGGGKNRRQLMRHGVAALPGQRAGDAACPKTSDPGPEVDEGAGFQVCSLLGDTRKNALDLRSCNGARLSDEIYLPCQPTQERAGGVWKAASDPP